LQRGNYCNRNIDIREQLFLLIYGDFIIDRWVRLKDLGEMLSEYLGLLFITSSPSSILLSDGQEFCLRAFKPLGGFLQRIVGFSRWSQLS